MEEIWKDIEGYEGYYQISNLGRVKSLERKIVREKFGSYIYKGKYKKLEHDKDGYLVVSLYKDGIYKLSKVHRLVAQAFISNSKNKPEVNHINGVKDDNRVENLEWVTTSENQFHALNIGLRISLKGENHGMSKLTPDLINLIRGESDKITQKEIAKKYNISQQHVSDIRTGKRWKHI